MNDNPSDKDYASGKGKRDSVSECQKLCQSRKGCLFFTYHSSSKTCWLKAGRITRASFAGWVSGRKYCQGKFFYRKRPFNVTPTIKLHIVNMLVIDMEMKILRTQVIK